MIRFILLLAFVLAATLRVHAEDYAEELRKDRPAAWWRFDEAAKAPSVKAADASGNACPAEYRGNIENAPGLPGTSGHAARFDGKNALVHAPGSPKWRSNSLSAEFWFRSTQPFKDRFWPGSATFLSTATSGPGSSDWLVNAASQANLDEGRLLAETGPAGKPRDLYLPSKAGDPLNDGHWHHVVLTRAETGEARLYVDGELHFKGSDGGGTVIANRALEIGGETVHPGGRFLKGDMDEVALYTRVLSAERVRAHFEAIRPHLPPRPAKRVVKLPKPAPPGPPKPPPEPVPVQPPGILDEKIAETARAHWAFQPPRRTDPPKVKNPAWIRNPVDAFVLAQLEKAGRAPAPPAPPSTLLRRAHFDLLGLPPGPETAAAFDKDPAWPGMIETLLADPHYGERYGRHWLDVARYADSAGYELDNFFHHAAHYRDYVIRAFNADTPFDRFIREQIAGDLLYPENPSIRHATGFYTVGPWREEGEIKRPERDEYHRLTDAADATGDAFVGLSLGCARCHDHKFDPLTQYDYFALQAVLATSGIALLETDETRGKNAEAKRKGARMHQVVERSRPPVTRLLRRGDLERPAGSVPAQLPGFFSPKPPGGTADAPRVQLADWIASPANPLTARVIANRVWMWHFGRPLVATPNDFGTQGAKPTHPALLDYLAGYLVEHEWRLKDLHRLIMQSATYRMDSRHPKDPEPGLFDRYPRRRLEAEAIWDNLLAVSGVLNRERFGPPVYPPIDPEILKAKLNAKWNTPGDRSAWARRGIYVAVHRSVPWPFFESFNSTPPILSCGRRDGTVVSPQALTLLNNRLPEELAGAFAERLRRECGEDPGRQVARGWLLAFGRPASDPERDATLAYLQDAKLETWCLALFNANEFIYID